MKKLWKKERKEAQNRKWESNIIFAVKIQMELNVEWTIQLQISS